MNSVGGCLAAFLLISIGSCAAERRDDRFGKPEATVSRIAPQDAMARIKSGASLLVCGYDSADKFHNNHLQGAILLQELRGRENSLAKEQEIIFYCA